MIFYSIHFNRPDFIKIQNECIKSIGGKLVVINNNRVNKKIKEICSETGIKYYETNLDNSGYNNPSISHGIALNYTRDIIDYSEDWCLLDHDFFPTKEIDFIGYNIISVPQIRNEVTYLWPGYMAGKKSISLSNIDFLPVYELGDTGVNTMKIVDENKEFIKYISMDPIVKDIPKGQTLQTFPTLMKAEDYGIHYLNGSSWMSASTQVMDKKNKDLLEILKIKI